MKYKIFKRKIKVIEDLLDINTKVDKRIQKALSFNNSDVQVYTDWYSAQIDELVNILSDEIKDKNDWIDWYIYESRHNKDLNFSVNGTEYKGSRKNIWKLLTKKI